METYRRRLVRNISIKEKHKRKVQEQLENERTKAPEYRDKELIADLEADCDYIEADIKRYKKEKIALEGLFLLFLFLFFSFLFISFSSFGLFILLIIIYYFLYYLNNMLSFF